MSGLLAFIGTIFIGMGACLIGGWIADYEYKELFEPDPEVLAAVNSTIEKLDHAIALERLA